MAALEDLDGAALEGLGWGPGAEGGGGGDGGGGGARRRLRDAVAALARGHPDLAGLADMDADALVEQLLALGLDPDGLGQGHGHGQGAGAGAEGLDPHLPLLQLFLQTLLPWNDIRRDN